MKRVSSSKTYIHFDCVTKFLGMKITKGAVVSICVDVRDYIKKDGAASKILVWQCEHENGYKFERTTSALNFRISDVPSVLPKCYGK